MARFLELLRPPHRLLFMISSRTSFEFSAIKFQIENHARSPGSVESKFIGNMSCPGSYHNIGAIGSPMLTTMPMPSQR